ncbi:MAG TPA: hypothetical protein ENK05_11740 [Gammaproteobacteria bacterium]|nr:hypothetical protein [Gammaproteobacteria bacterium]
MAGELMEQPAAEPALVYSPHPLMPTRDRVFVTGRFLPGETIQGYLDRQGLDFGAQPVVLQLNDTTVPRERWDEVVPGEGDLISVRGVVHGGGGGGGSNPVRTILMIAVLVAAPYAGVWAASGALGGLIGTNAAYAVGYGAAVLAGSVLVNAIAPIPTPQLSDASGAFEAASPTYSLSGGSNMARPFQPLPLVIGTHRVFPDLGARPYTQSFGRDQYLFQVFNFGLSDMTLSDFRIGNTPISSFSDIETEESGADGALDLFPGNVDSVPGGDLTYAAGWITKTSSVDTTRLVVEVAGYLFRAGDQGIEDLRATLELEWRVVGATTWNPWWASGGTVELGSNSREPLRFAYEKFVTKGQYEVRVRRVTPDETDSRNTSNLTWTQLLSFQPDTADYSGQKRFALKIKASGQINGRVDRLSALATAEADVWDGAAWVRQATSNPAWWFLWLARGLKDAGGKIIAGAGLADAQIDIEAIKAWGAWCDSKNLQCNLVFDRPMTAGQMLDVIARCGRGAKTWANGKLGVVWDQAAQPSVQVFGMNNIRRSTFSVDYASRDLADEIVLRFINPAIEWQQDTVRATVPGVTNPTRPVELEIMGITSKDQAGREANLIAATHSHRRRRITWETDFEGMVCNRGDVVTLSHDLTQWGYSGRLVAGTTTVLSLDRKVPFTSGQAHYIGVRFPDGSYNIYDVVYQAGEADVITLSTPLPSAPDDDPNHPPMDYTWVFEPKATPGKKVKILDVKPLSDRLVRITATDEDDDYYLQEFNSYTYLPGATQGTQVPTVTKLEVADTLIRAGAGFATTIVAVWDVDGEYGGAIVRVGYNGAQPAEIGRTLDRRFEFQGPASGTATIEVTAFNLAGEYGPASKISQTYTIEGKSAPPQDVAGFTAARQDYSILLSWYAVPDVDVAEYEIRRGTDWATSTFLARTRSTEFLWAMAMSGIYDFLIKAVDTSGNWSTNAAAASLTITAPAQPSVSNHFKGEQVHLAWQASAGDFPIVEYEIRYGADWATGTFVATIKGTSYAVRVDFSGTRRYWVAAIDAAGNLGTASAIDVVITPPAQPSLTQEVIDNNVLLRWAGTAGTLPIATYEIRRGADFETATVLQTVDGTFATFFESLADDYTYWVVAIDTAGNYGQEQSIVAKVNEPPDYVLQADWFSDFSGTKTNAIVMANGDLLVPVDDNDTYEQHFVNNGYNSPQDQVDAGFPHFIQPSVNSAVYEEEFDYGTVLPATLVSVVMSSSLISGAVNVTPTISVRKLATDPWTDYVGVWQVFATDFQYVKVRLDFSASGGDDLLQVTNLEVKLDVKLKNDAGDGVANAADTGGTTVTFNRQFIDITSLTVTAKGTSSVTAVYDFVDAPYPTDFSVYLFDSSGNRVSGEFSWAAKGY